MKIAFCQISNTLINPTTGSNEEKYFDNLYSKVPGYKKSTEFWEVPLWIAKASYSIPEGELYVVRDIEQSVEDLSAYDAVCFSVLEVNRKLVLTVIAGLPCHIKIILGGYVKNNFQSLERFNIYWFDTLRAGIESLGYAYQDGISYKLFKGISTIPRLSLSDGCLYQCAFCCVEKTVKEYSTGEIYAEADTFKDLDFELVYVNDKTFGQAKNHALLPCLYESIRHYNPNFKGFIIQTTATNFLKLSPEVLACVAYVELGVESFNDDILKAMNKPHRTTNIEFATTRLWALKAQGSNIKLIPNIMVSLPGETRETYQHTLNFLSHISPITSHVNIYGLALYHNTKLSDTLDHVESDKNENSLNKSWSDSKTDSWFYAEVVKFANNQIEKGINYG